jgi:hypothetical protein
MARDVARAELYRASINLWVEDTVSREYLTVLWNSPQDIFFLIGGGNEGVRGAVKDAESAAFSNVFGLIDRDFRQSNRSDWNTPGKTFHTFILPVHEIENYLLDPHALAASRLNTLACTAAQIEDHLNQAAERLTWWSACRDVVAELKRRFRDDFVTDPPCGTISDKEAAAHHICNSPWFRKLSLESSRTGESDVRQLLSAAHAKAQSNLADGSWRGEFAGKEIYRDIGSRICDRSALPGYQAKRVEFDTDLAKDVAAWQSAYNRVPHDLAELLAALRRRIVSTTSSLRNVPVVTPLELGSES